MGRIINLRHFNESRNRNPTESNIEEVVSLPINNGDVVVVKSNEVREVINDYLREELELFTDDTITNLKFQVTTDISQKVQIFEQRLNDHIDEKLDRLTERIAEKILSRVIEEEVNKRLDSKLKKLKELL